MNEEQTRADIQADLRSSGAKTVIYLEGRSDPTLLAALLGNRGQTPIAGGFVASGIFFKVPESGGSGSHAIRYRIEVGKSLSNVNVFGVIDGDGLSLAELESGFDPPFLGPLFTWKAYCIENLIAKTGWPAGWGETPDWQAELVKFGPYVAINRLGLELQAILQDLRIAKHLNPVEGQPLVGLDEIAVGLTAGRERISRFDVEQRFREELARFEVAVSRSPDEAHAFLNGKWLIRHMAPALTGRKSDKCLSDWIAHARSVGGLDEVCRWCDRIAELDAG